MFRLRFEQKTSIVFVSWILSYIGIVVSRCLAANGLVIVMVNNLSYYIYPTQHIGSKHQFPLFFLEKTAADYWKT